MRFPSSPLLGKNEWPSRSLPESIEQKSGDIELTFSRSKTGKVRSQTIEIMISAPDFEISGRSKRRLKVYPDKESNIISFLLMPVRHGNCRVNVEVYGKIGCI